MRRIDLVFLAACAVALLGAGLAQQPAADAKPAVAPVPATYTGCVMQSPNVATIYLLATKDRCLVLSGKYDVAQAAGHETSFKGTLSDAVGNKPPSLTVQSTLEVRAACSHVCTLPPPAHRGLGFQTKDPQQGDKNAQPETFPAPKGNASAPHF